MVGRGIFEWVIAEEWGAGFHDVEKFGRG
jgi:hypothetical protein